MYVLCILVTRCMYTNGYLAYGFQRLFTSVMLPVTSAAVLSNCLGSEYTCASARQCVKAEYVCDGERDCNDGSDEEPYQNCDGL